MLWQQQQLLQPNGNISTLLPFSVHCCCNFVVVFVKESKGYVSFVQWSIHSHLSIRWFRPLISCFFVFFFFFYISRSYMWYLVKTALLSSFLSFLNSCFPSFFRSFSFFLPFLMSFNISSNFNYCYYNYHLVFLFIPHYTTDDGWCFIRNMLFSLKNIYKKNELQKHCVVHQSIIMLSLLLLLSEVI